MKPNMQMGQNNMGNSEQSPSPMSPFKPRTSQYSFTRPGGDVQTVNRGTPNHEGVSEMSSRFKPEFIQSVIPNIQNILGNRMNRMQNPGAMSRPSFGMRGRV
jgi:hypothetical protein